MSSRYNNTATELRSRRLCDRVSEVVAMQAHEPSLALYRIQEHTRSTVPTLARGHNRLTSYVSTGIDEVMVDVDFAIDAVSSFPNALTNLDETLTMLKEALYQHQQIQYRNSKRPSSTTSKPTSAYSSSAKN